MNDNEINKLIHNLDWHLPKETQEKTILNLQNIDDDKLVLLIQPGGKELWENASIILKNIGYPRIKGIISKLFEWIQDLNWPGALIIISLFESIKTNELIPYIEETLIKAEQEKDYIWIASIKLLIRKLKIRRETFERMEIYDILELAEW